MGDSFNGAVIVSEIVQQVGKRTWDRYVRWDRDCMWRNLLDLVRIEVLNSFEYQRLPHKDEVGTSDREVDHRELMHLIVSVTREGVLVIDLDLVGDKLAVGIQLREYS